jgi:flagellar biosynthesis protein FlhF
MQLKSYEAPSMQEACRKIKADLGDDAVIFSTRTIRSASAAPYGDRRSWVEVTAAVDRADQKVRRQAHGDISPGRVLRAHQHGACNRTDKASGSHRTGWSGGLRPDSRPKLHRLLQEAGFKNETAWYLIGSLGMHTSDNAEPQSMIRMIESTIRQHIPVNTAIDLEKGKKKAVAFIGPTGVGKTTTLAKVAAQYCFAHKARVKIISMDTYRIGAVDQLNTYASIMHIPFEVAHDDQTLSMQLAEHDDCDLLLIDTSGRNYLNQDVVRDVRRWLEDNSELEVHMLLSATSSEDVLRSTLERFTPSVVDRLIITKVDETPRQGHLFEVLSAAGIPVSYITTGQKVPEDILPATHDLLANLFVNGYAA